jgi:predicted nuclease of predicted toxin-antitoxin system
MNISPKTVDALRKQGWEVIRVSEILPMNASDEEVLEFARREGRFIVTQNLDFSTLLALGGHNQPSLITLRLAMSDPETVTRKLLGVLPGLEEVLRQGRAVQCSDCG